MSEYRKGENMAEIYKFFNSAPGDPRMHYASDFADYFGSVLSTGLLHTDEIPGMRVTIEQGTLNTVVSPGKAVMKGYLYENTTPLTLTHGIPESNADRIDRVVLRLDLRNSERSVKLHVKEGIPDVNPVEPSLQRDEFIYELSLARIRVRANTSSFNPNDLTDERYYEEYCGFVNSLLTIPTSQFIEEWNAFLADRNEEFEAASGDFSDQMAHFESVWNEWIYGIQADTFARVVNKQTGVVYRLVLDEDTLYLEEM